MIRHIIETDKASSKKLGLVKTSDESILCNEEGVIFVNPEILEDIEILQDDVLDLGSKINENKEECEKSLENLREETNNSIEEVNNSINKTNEDLALVKNDVEEINSDIDAINKEIEDINEDIETTSKELDDKITELKDRFDEIIEEGGNESIEIAEAKKPFNTLKERLDDIEDKAVAEDISLGKIQSNNNRILTVYNENGDIIGVIDKDGSSFEKLNVTELTCQNTILTQKAVNYYVDSVNGDDSNIGSSAKPLKTISEAISRLNKYLLGNCYIRVKNGTYNEKLVYEGFTGKGTLYTNFEGDDITINGSLVISSNSAAVRFNGNETKRTKINHTTSENDAVRINYTQYVYLTYFEINGNSATKFNINCNQGSGIAVKNCILNNTTDSAIVAYECSNIYAINNIGSGHAKYSIYSGSGSTICIWNKVPYASLEHYNDTGIVHGTATKTNADGSTGSSNSGTTTVPELSKTVNYGVTKMISYRGVDGWSRAGAYQGKYDSSNSDNYLHYGAMVIDSNAIKTLLTGKTVESIKLTIKRHAEGQGIGQPATASLHIWGSTTKGTGSKPTLYKKYATVNSVSKGQQVNITLPTAFITDLINQGLNSLVLYTADGSSYLKLDDVFDLEITYK